MPTIYDVAKLAGVSTYTVSSVLNRSARVSKELTDRVLRAVEQLDYTPNEVARSLQTRRSRTIGMLIPDIANPFYAKVVRGVEERLKQDGYTLVLGNTYNDAAEQTRYLNLFRARQTDGLLVIMAAGGQAEIQKLIVERRPVVFVARDPGGMEADCVAADNQRGTELAMHYLLGKGHRRIGIVVGQLELSTSADRVAAWKESLKQAGLSTAPTLVGEADWTYEGGNRAALEMLRQSERPTAIFAANFLMMTGVLAAVRELQLRCPDDVEIVTSDESEWLDVFDPPISTVVQPSFEMGERAAGLLLDRIANPARPPRRVILTPELHVRERRS